MTQEHYMFIMQIANVLIGDDHSFINLQRIGEYEHIKYAGFVATYIDGNVVVVHSRNASIPRWSILRKINKIPIIEWL
jgi:hypothetical protein